ncbi:MAG: transglutaminase domain-containing protein [Thermoanaerobaculaceae bacterium]|nr:transglutaminase domain-containing protein [Thermoanaerobaculaceae bacterium]
MNGSLLRQRLLGGVALAVAVPVVTTGIGHGLFVAPFVLVAVVLLLARRPLRPLPAWVENLLAVPILLAVLSAGGWEFGVLRPVTHLTLLLAAVRLPGCGMGTRFWSVGGVVGLVGVAGVASATHPLLVPYLVGLQVALLLGAARLVALELGEAGVGRGGEGGSGTLATTAVTVVVGVAFAAAIFVAAPRLRSPFATASFGGRAVSGFRDAVALHRIGQITASRAVVMRVRFEEGESIQPEWLRFVGSTLQHYRGGVWAQGRRTSSLGTPSAQGWTRLATRGVAPLVEARFVLERPQEVLFVPPGVVEVQLPPVAVARGALGALRVPVGTTSRLAYTVRFDPARITQERPEPADLEVPARLSWVRSLARQAAAGSRTTLGAALAIEAYLRANYTYSARSDAPLRRDPVEWFLQESRQGHCEFFASSMVLMLRVLGIPARLQAGYAGGESDGRGGFTVRDSHAHAWVVAWVGNWRPGEGVPSAPRGGWRVFDPTPPEGQPTLQGSVPGWRWVASWERLESAWDRWVLTFSLADQLEAVRAVLELGRRAVRPGVMAPVLGVVAVALLLWWGGRGRDRPRRGAQGGAAGALEMVYREAAALGLGGGGGVTPRALLAATARAVPEAVAELSRLVAWHEAVRYAQRRPAGRMAAWRSARRVVRQLRRHRGR